MISLAEHGRTMVQPYYIEVAKVFEPMRFDWTGTSDRIHIDASDT